MANNYRNPVYSEPRIFSGSNIMHTPMGNVRTSQSLAPPPLPPAIYSQNNSYGAMNYNSYPSPMSMFGGGGYGFGNYGGFGSYGSGYGGGYGSYSRFGNSYMNGNDPESRFIHLAEESSRPAFQSIESLVGAIGNIATMLDSTFFAITSSFRAILGVAANFGRLRGVFAQFWSTFAIFRGLNWIYRKFLYWLRISKIDPSTTVFKEAFAAAAAGVSGSPPITAKAQSPWPVIAFIGFIFSAPYLIMKLLGSVSDSALEESRRPQTWVRPIPSQVIYDFQARSPEEISIRAGQTIWVAPKEVQNTHKLMNTGWALATVDHETSGLIPITYVQGPKQIKRDTQAQVQNWQQQLQSQEPQQPELLQDTIPQQQKPTLPEPLQKQQPQDQQSELSVISEIKADSAVTVNNGKQDFVGLPTIPESVETSDGPLDEAS